MLDATIRIVTYGDAAFARDIVDITICNDGTGTPEVGNYWAMVNGVEYSINGFDRARGALALVGEVARVVEAEHAKAD